MKGKDKDPRETFLKEVASMILDIIAWILLSIVAIKIDPILGTIIAAAILIQTVANFIRGSNED